MKKKILIILLMFIILIDLSGCSFKKSSNNVTKTKKGVKTEKVEKKNTKKESKKKTVKKVEKKETKKEEKNKNVTLTKDIVVGHYELIELTDGKITYNKEELDELKQTGYVVTIDFDKEKGTFHLGDESSEFKYDDKYIYIEEEKIQYDYSDNKLLLKENEQTLTFEKTK